MAKLPTVQDMGPRRIPTPTTGVRGLQGTQAVGEALQGAGQALGAVADMVGDREATAAAKERDTFVADQLRDLMYNPETGYMNDEGRIALGRMGDMDVELQRIEAEARKGLNNMTTAKLESSLTRRMESARNQVSTHASVQRKTWLDGAGEARIISAQQDALLNPTATMESVNTIKGEVISWGRTHDKSLEEVGLEMDRRISELYAAQVTNLASHNPIDALTYLQDNEGDILPSVRADLMKSLTPHVKDYRGRMAGAEAAATTGMADVMQVASRSVGLSETDQKAALQEYLANGGQNLDPEVTAWCAAWINATLSQAGVDGTGSLMARSFLNWGQGVEKPEVGDVVVLSRGAPPSGHVGLFEGFNEDGSVRLLGGNQGDEVNVSSYASGRILGFRRAPATEGKQDAISAMRELAAIKDPKERGAAISEFNLLMGIEGDANAAAQDGAMNAGWQLVENGGDIDGLSFPEKQRIGFKGVKALQDYQAGKGPEDGTPFSNALYEMYGSDKAAFLAQDPNSWLGKLSKSEFVKLRDMRSKLMRGDADTVIKPATLTAMMSQASSATKELDGKQKNAFQTNMINWATANPAEALDPGARQDQINRMLLDVTIDSSYWPLSAKTAKTFEVNLDGNPYRTDDDMPIETFTGSSIEINGVMVPDEMKEAVIRALGPDATAQELFNEISTHPMFQ